MFLASRCGRHAALELVLCGAILICTRSTCLSARSVRLAWDPSPSDNVAGYNIYYGVASRAYTNMLAAGAATNLLVPNLIEGTRYYFTATSMNSRGLESHFSNEAVYTVPMPPTNRPPTLNPLAAVTINEGAGPQTVNLSGISSGATNEAQTLSITASSSNPALIPTPTVNYTSPNSTGSISFNPVAFAFGSATVTVTVNDGGASNNVVSRSFVVTVNSGQPGAHPECPGQRDDQRRGRAANGEPVGHQFGRHERGANPRITASSSNPALIPTPTVNYTSPNSTGSISFNPVAFAFGSATVTVTVNDGGASNNVVSRSFVVTVNPVNQAPTLNALANVTINEGAGLQTVNLSGISSGATNEAQTLSVTASSSNPALIPTPTVNYTSPNSTGSISFNPVAFAFGTATVTVTVNDGGRQQQFGLALVLGDGQSAADHLDHQQPGDRHGQLDRADSVHGWGC